MTQKIHGAAYAGIWVEKKVSFAKISFFAADGTTPKNLKALAQADTYLLGTTTATSATTVADSTFGVVESAIVQALKVLETRATVLGVSTYNATDYCVDVMLGVSEGWFADANGLITATPLPVVGAQAVVTTGGITPTTLLGSLVTVRDTVLKYTIQFATFDGKMTIGTLANGALALGPGATIGYQTSSVSAPTGDAGYYPAPI